MIRFGRLAIVTVLSVGLCVSPNVNMPVSTLSGKEMTHVLSIAHRGAVLHAPENTIAAFDKSVALGADYIELDVQLSQDGHVIVFHDTTIDRVTTDTGRVKDMTLAELRRLDVGRTFSEAFAGESIPTLHEVLERYGGKIGILIDIKHPDLNIGIEEKLAETLIAQDLDTASSNVILQAFDTDTLRLLHTSLPSIPLGVLIDKPAQLTESALRDYAGWTTYINPHQHLASKSMVRRIHNHGMKVLPWTARSNREIHNLLQAGADGIITDLPDQVPGR